jgi:hypothetical protein
MENCQLLGIRRKVHKVTVGKDLKVVLVYLQFLVQFGSGRTDLQ